MSVRAQTTIDVNGVPYDAVTFKQAALCCVGCALSGRACWDVGCYPDHRADGLWAIWKRRITDTPVEGSSQRLRDAEILERMNREHVG